MKKKKIIIISSIFLSLSIVSFFSFSVVQSIKNKKSNNIVESSIKKDSSINSFRKIENKIVGNVPRHVNKQIYETKLIKLYGNEFKYPSWNYNYEKDNNRYQNINGHKIDLMQLVFDERVDFQGTEVKYSDPNFILNEIKNNTLKKHPAADLWYEQKISDSTKAINKFFSIPSSNFGPTALGLYIPPGEIATLKFSSKTLQRMMKYSITNFKVVLNSSYWDNYQPGNSGQISNRYPYVKTEFNVDIFDVNRNNGEFKFGSPFGGTISIKLEYGSHLISDTYNKYYQSYENYEFNVLSAIEMLSYTHNVTSEENWNEQIQRILKGEITAPGMSIDFAYGSANIASTAPNVFAYQKIDEIVYPFKILEKWTSFLFISEYFASRDINNNVTKLDFKFCDDIWGGAGAWGGGNALYSPLNWAKSSFLNGYSNWSITNNWGVFHEINHNFEQNSALFTKRSHGETNQVTMVNLSLISDVGRWRSLYNPNADYNNSDWTKLQNMYSTIKYIIDRNYASLGNSEYELQNIILYALGTYNFIEYVRYDITHNPNTGGFKEIVELSDYFKLNFWPALSNFHGLWNNDWPASYNEATAEQKLEIDRLNKNYKSFDFVANIFAVGHYLYNEEEKQYNYTNDMQAPIDIPDGKPYIFDFEKGINSANKNFQWDKLQFNNKTILGGHLVLDQNNSKKLIYNPPKNKTGQIDEFDISITPSNFIDKAINYVDQYKWKIKIRLVANLPIVSLFKDSNVKNNNNNFYKDYEYMKNDENIEVNLINDPRLGIPTILENKNQWQRSKLAFNFIAPKTGSYQFQLFTKGYAFIVNKKESDNTIWWKSELINNAWTNVKKITVNKGEIIPFEIYFTTDWEVTKLNFRAIIDNSETCNIFDNSTIPWANELTNNQAIYLEEKYNYQSRKIEYNDFQTSLFGLNVSRNIEILKSSDYVFSSINPKDDNIDTKLKEYDWNYFEHWGSKPYNMSFSVNFNKPEKIGTIFFTHRTNHHYEARPTSLRLKDQDGRIIYEGVYGEQMNDRNKIDTTLILDRIYELTRIDFEFVNEKLGAIIFDAIKFSPFKILKINKMISSKNENIFISKRWEEIENQPEINKSYLNNSSILSKTKNDYIEFELFAQGFDIIGQKNFYTSNFDIYINDKFIANVNTKNNQRLDNQILYSFDSNSNSGELLRIKIINKENKSLFLNYFQTYGKKVYIKTKEN